MAGKPQVTGHRKIVGATSRITGCSTVMKAKNARPRLQKIQKDFTVENDTSKLSVRKPRASWETRGRSLKVGNQS